MLDGVTQVSPVANGCGHPGCSVSGTIAGQVSFGRGTLDPRGFWEIPCYQCAKAWRARHPGVAVWPCSAEHEKLLNNLPPSAKE